MDCKTETCCEVYLQKRGVVNHLAILQDTDTSMYLFLAESIDKKDVLFAWKEKIENDLFKAERIYQEEIQKLLKKDYVKLQENELVLDSDNNPLFIKRSFDDVPAVICVDNNGLLNFDLDVEYLFHGKNENFYLVEDKFGEIVECFPERFSKIKRAN